MTAPGEHPPAPGHARPESGARRGPGPPQPVAAGPATGSRAGHAAEELRTLRERVAAARWRGHLAARRPLDAAYRVGVGLVGALVVVFGVITIPLPGPGWLTVLAGLFLLATEFAWAERLLHFTRGRVEGWTRWLGGRSVIVRWGVAGLTAACVYGALVLTLHLFGVPGWMPGWVPLWR